MEFLFIRNRLLQTWLHDPVHELTADKAQTVIHLPHPGMVYIHVYVYDVYYVHQYSILYRTQSVLPCEFFLSTQIHVHVLL